jgi:hypothetical protein
MKKMRLPVIAVCFIAINSVMSSCVKDNKINPSKITLTKVNTTIAKTKWGVTLYKQAGSVDTADFSGYFLTFNPDGTLVATSPSGTKKGIWYTMENNDSIKIFIDFGFEIYGSFVSISDDWIVLKDTNSKIELKNITDDDSIDLLTFEKIQ